MKIARPTRAFIYAPNSAGGQAGIAKTLPGKLMRYIIQAADAPAGRSSVWVRSQLSAGTNFASSARSEFGV